MKVALASDIHVEFGTIELNNTENADVLILSGDICIADDMRIGTDFGKGELFLKFFQQCSKEFPEVIYIAGNHEHYHGDFAFTYDILRKSLTEFTNIHILDKESIVIGNTTFFGGTLWTDMNKEDPITIHSMKRMMNDFIQVKNSNVVVGPYWGKSRFLPEDAVAEHKEFLSRLDVILKDDTVTDLIVVGHHSPSKLSTHPRYSNDDIMNGGYSSNLDELIMDNPKIRLWTHGHTHHDFDYFIGQTRIVCNPRGYINYEPQADNFELKFLEV